jgi:ribosomal protein L12E/L44/L45/RPP1/RPP2
MTKLLSTLLAAVFAVAAVSPVFAADKKEEKKEQKKEQKKEEKKAEKK